MLRYTNHWLVISSTIQTLDCIRDPDGSGFIHEEVDTRALLKIVSFVAGIVMENYERYLRSFEDGCCFWSGSYGKRHMPHREEGK